MIIANKKLERALSECKPPPCRHLEFCHAAILNFVEIASVLLRNLVKIS